MKKLLSLVLVLCLLALPACGTMPDETISTTTTSEDITSVDIEIPSDETTSVETTTSIDTPPVDNPPVVTDPVIYSMYQEPGESGLTEEEKGVILRQFTYPSANLYDWYDADRISEVEHSRHHGWRYYGHVDDSVLFAIPSGAPGADGSYSLSTVALYAYKDSTYTLLTPEKCTEDVYAKIESYHVVFEAATLRDCAENDPYWFGGQNLPPLGESPYSDEELKTNALSAESYLGTYNGYSVYFSSGAVRLTVLEWLGGVPFYTGETYTILTYKDGAVELLRTTYNNGNLTYEDLRAIAYYMYGDVFPVELYDYTPKPGSR